MNAIIRIGTRESELAVWQATLVKNMLAESGYSSTLVYIKSEGDADLKTALYEMGVQGIFTRSLDNALLNNSIDIAVHSMKDVPTQLPAGIVQAAVLKRGSYSDLFVVNTQLKIEQQDIIDLTSLHINSYSQTTDSSFTTENFEWIIGTSSIRRKAQWLHRYPNSIVENIRGNVNTRMKKVAAGNWHGAIFASAGLERINLRPANAIELNWMLPAPAQGAIMIVCRGADEQVFNAAAMLNDVTTATCTKIERDFLKKLLGGCSTPISALAQINNDELYFCGNIFSVDGKHKAVIERSADKKNTEGFGKKMAVELLNNGGREIAGMIRHAK